MQRSAGPNRGNRNKVGVYVCALWRWLTCHIGVALASGDIDPRLCRKQQKTPTKKIQSCLIWNSNTHKTKQNKLFVQRVTFTPEVSGDFSGLSPTEGTCRRQWRMSLQEMWDKDQKVNREAQLECLGPTVTVCDQQVDHLFLGLLFGCCRGIAQWGKV